MAVGLVPSNARTLSRKFDADAVGHEFSRVSWFYDLWAKLTESKATKRVLELARIEDGEKILEVAVGTGLVFEEIAKRNRSGLNDGVDISRPMIARANRRLERSEVRSYDLQIGSAYRLPFKEATFNLIVSNYMFDLLPESDFDSILREFRRVLVKSGRIIITTMAFGIRWYNGVWYFVVRHFPALLTNCRPISMSEHLARAGFDSVGVEAISQNTFPSQILTGRR